jgi:hypothetical protein
MRTFTDRSAATREEKARRFLRALANGHTGRYFCNDGWPRQADILQDAAAALEVFESLAKKSTLATNQDRSRRRQYVS